VRQPSRRPALLDRKDLGEIAVGAGADFVVVDGDPLENPGLLARPALVLKAGRQL
jgi:imidazolonepropionase-like amidohydrolase